MSAECPMPHTDSTGFQVVERGQTIDVNANSWTPRDNPRRSSSCVVRDAIDAARGSRNGQATREGYCSTCEKFVSAIAAKDTSSFNKTDSFAG